VTHPTPERASVPSLGTTVTLRVRTPVGPISVVGELVAADNEHWSIRRRDRSLTLVAIDMIEAKRVVPPGRSRLVSALDLEQAAALGWRALETAQLGDWLLRAAGGFTGRANSALAAGDPGQPLDAALEAVQAWYDERGLPTQIQVPTGAAPAELTSILANLGWSTSPGVHVMTAEVAHALRALPDPATRGLEVRIDDQPDDGWLACYRRTNGPMAGVARKLLTNHPNAIFASIRDGDTVLAIARSAVDAKWAGLFAVEVDPDRRQRGLGAAVSVAALREAARRGGRQAYLQVSIANLAGVALYERLNFTVHHDYVYWSPPAAT
jgi:ribosomal protein S18 acetylase RimI-like enzyme